MLFMSNINEIKENFKRFTILLLLVVYYKYQIIWANAKCPCKIIRKIICDPK